jgi:hypothetical protein
MCTSFKVELLQGFHAFDSTYRTADTFKIALLQNVVNGTYGSTTTNYSNITANSDEVSATGYTTGGGILVVNPTPTSGTSGGTTAYLGFNNYTWNGAISSSGAVIYNSTQGGRAVAVLAFGKIINSTTAFTVQFPTAAAGTAIVQIQ